MGKIIFQTEKTAASASHHILPTLRLLVRQGGMRSLFAGNFASCLRVLPFGGIVCISYGRILSFLPADNELDACEPVWRAVAGASAGCLATVFTYPLDLVRARLVVHASTDQYVPGVF